MVRDYTNLQAPINVQFCGELYYLLLIWKEISQCLKFCSIKLFLLVQYCMQMHKRKLHLSLYGIRRRSYDDCQQNVQKEDERIIYNDEIM